MQSSAPVMGSIFFRNNGLCLFILCVYMAPGWQHTDWVQISDGSLHSRQESRTAPLVDFQVAAPVLTPTSPSTDGDCVYTQELMSHVFAFSYGIPFVGRKCQSSGHSPAEPRSGNYTPPPCGFNRVTMNLTVTSRGVQFDRLGIMYLGDIEVFRTSTAEPTSEGIVWTYTKEMEQYNSLWKTKQQIIFDLGNLVNEKYTGTFNTTLTATFFTVPGPRLIADQILPISGRRSSAQQGSAFSIPSEAASINHRLPLNVRQAVVSLAACGQAEEEFWYTNVLSSEKETFAGTSGSMNGYSSFREVQLLIDGQLAGVAWPFPVIFTGGIAPGLWRPIVGIDAFDLREQEIDITPWLPHLCDGASHRFEIKVVGLNDDGDGHAVLSETVGSSWVVSGKIFLFLNENGDRTTGYGPSTDAPPPEITISSRVSTNSSGANETLTSHVSVTRHLWTTSAISTPTSLRLFFWRQDLSYSNSNDLSKQGIIQTISQTTTGTGRSASRYEHTYRYPLSLPPQNPPDPPHPPPPPNRKPPTHHRTPHFGITASLQRGLDSSVSGPAVFPDGIPRRPGSSWPAYSGAVISTTQTGSAAFLAAGDASSSSGTTAQDFALRGAVARAHAAATGGGGAGSQLRSNSWRTASPSATACLQMPP